MSTYQSRDLRLQDVVVWIDEGRIRLPEFQRDFTWAISDQRALLDSIQKSYPVGTLLLLELEDEEKASPFGQRNFKGAPVPTKPAELLVLDGQQRLSSCYRAFAATAGHCYCIDLAKLFERTAGQPSRPVDFADLIVVRARPTHIENLLYTRNLLPFEFLTDRNTLRERLATYRTNLAKKPETAAFGKFVDVYLEGYVDVYFDYRFPAVVLPGTLDIEAVANVFTKINTTGLRLSAFDLCVATLFPKGVRLRELLATARERDAVKAVDQDGTNLLQTTALLAGKAPKKAALVKNIQAQDIHDHWDDAVGGIDEAGQLLAKVGAPDASSIPYDAMIPALAATLARTPDPTNPAEREAIRRRVVRWVQQAAFLQRYNEGTDVKQAADFPQAVTWFAGGATPTFLDDPVVWQDSWNRLGRSGARYRAFVALLNETGPRDLVETTKRLGRGLPDRVTAQLHHVFPRAYLKGEKVPAPDIDLALNITFLTPESNNFISDRAPSVYLEHRIQELVDSGAPRHVAIGQLKSILAEHFVDEAGWEAMIHDDYEGFLAARASAVRAQLGMRGVTVVLAQVEQDEEEPFVGDADDADASSPA